MASGAVYQQLFTRVPSEHFHSPELAFEFLRLCRDSLPLFGRSLGVLKLSFPNLFKACSLVPRPGGCRGEPGRPGLGVVSRALPSTTGPRASLRCDHRAQDRRPGGRGEGEAWGGPGHPHVTGKQPRCQGLVLNLSGLTCGLVPTSLHKV